MPAPISDEEKYVLTQTSVVLSEIKKFVKNNDLERLLLIAENKTPFVMASLAWIDDMPIEVLSKLADSGDELCLSHIVNHKSTPKDTLEKIYYDYGFTNSRVAHTLIASDRIPYAWAERLLIENDSRQMRFHAARRHDMTLSMLKHLVGPWRSNQRDRFERDGLYDIGDQIVLGFYYGEYDNLASSAELDEVIEFIIEKTQNVYKNSSSLLFEPQSGLSRKLIEKYSANIQNLDTSQRKAFAANPLTPVERLEELINDESKTVILALAGNPSAGDYVHNYLLHNTKDYKVKMNIAKATTNVDILYTILSRTKSVQILQAGQLNPLYEQLQGRV